MVLPLLAPALYFGDTYFGDTEGDRVVGRPERRSSRRAPDAEARAPLGPRILRQGNR